MFSPYKLYQKENTKTILDTKLCYIFRKFMTQDSLLLSYRAYAKAYIFEVQMLYTKLRLNRFQTNIVISGLSTTPYKGYYEDLATIPSSIFAL